MLTNFNMFPLLEFDICRIFWKILFLTVLMLFFGVSQVGENQDEAKMIDVKKVPSCPYTKEKWLKDATAKNCSSKNVTFKYHCLLDHWRNQSFVFCGEDKRIIGFYCPEYDETRGRIRENYKMKCIELNPPCPIKYNSSDVFKYPDCIKSNIINTSNTTTKEKIKENIDYSKADWLIAVMFLMVYPFLLFTMTVVHLFLYRHCNRRIRDRAEPSFQDFKLSSMMGEMEFWPEANMEPVATFTETITSDLRWMSGPFKISVPEDETQPSFAKGLLSAIHIQQIVDEINLLSKRALDLQGTLYCQENYTTPDSIQVFEVEVIRTQGLLKIIEKDNTKTDIFFCPTSGNLVRVIWIYSKSVNVVDAKLTVFLNYESYLKKETIYIHHELENPENVIKFSAYEQAKLLGTSMELISESVPVDSLGPILQAATDRVISKDTIIRLCNDVFLRDKNVNVGSTNYATYKCFLMSTVKRLKKQLVIQTLNDTAENLGSEISRGIFNHIKFTMTTKLDEKKSKLQFDIPNEIFTTVAVMVCNIISYIFDDIIAYAMLSEASFWSVDVNSRYWRRGVADEIYDTIVFNKTNFVRQIRSESEKICRQTVRELKEMSTTINDFKRSMGHTEQKTFVNEWKKRDVSKGIGILKTHPSVLMHLAGTRDGVDVVKVFLSGDDKEKAEINLREQYPEVPFEFVDVDTGYDEILTNIEQIEEFEQSLPEIDNEARQKVNTVINRHAEQVFANHSGVIGIEISNVRSDNNRMINELCIVLFCLDESIRPYGESPLPKNLEGYPCDIRKEFVMFGHYVDCQTLNIGSSIGIPSVKLVGSVGFFVRSNDSSKGFSKCGFLTAAHVAIEQWDELYEHRSLLSKDRLANTSHEIVHPSYLENRTNVVIGRVIESYFGNWTNGTGIDAAFVETSQRNLGGFSSPLFPSYTERSTPCWQGPVDHQQGSSAAIGHSPPHFWPSFYEEIHLPDENSLQFNGSILVKKRGRTTGDTIGKLVNDCMYVRVYSTKVHGRYYEFKNCFAVKQKDETTFFDKGDSGSGVFLIDKKDNSLKPLGIAFAFFRSKTAVCKIRQITDAFNVSVYGYEEPMDLS